MTETKQLLLPKPHPAQYDFITSTAKFRAFCAGIGAGKTYIGCSEMVAFATENPGNLHAIVAQCYDKDTEILTNNGWKFFKDLDKTELVASLVDNRLEFVKPKSYHKSTYYGRMIGLKSQEIDMLVTPNHRCLVKFKKGEWKIKEAQEIYGKYDYKFRKIAKWRCIKTKCKLNPPPDSSFRKWKFISPTKLNWFEFLGYWFAEGCAIFDKAKRRNVVCLTTVNDVEYCEDLLKRNNLKYSKCEHKGRFNYEIYSDDLSKEFQSYGKALTKKLPSYIKNAPVSQLRQFLLGFIIGDGHLKSNSHDQTQMWTSSKQLANDLQEISIKAGYNCALSSRQREGTFSNNREYYLCIRTPKKNEPKTHKKHWYEVKNYNDYIYCVEVPSGIVLVRRNGKHYFCGNTYPMLRDATQRTFFGVCPEELIERFNKTRNEVTLIDGSEIIFRSADEPENLRGPTLASFYLDEASRSAFKTWQIMMGRLRAPGIDCRAWLTTTPKGFNWIHKEFVVKDRANYEIFYCKTEENPYLSPDYISALKESYSGAFARQELEGQFVGFEGCVYPNFNRQLHEINCNFFKEGAVKGIYIT